MQSAEGTFTAPQTGLAEIFDEVGKFIVAHSGKAELVAFFVLVLIAWLIWAARTKPKTDKLSAVVRLFAAVLSIAGGLVTGAVLVFEQKPDCSMLSSENQVLAGLVGLLAGVAMGAREIRECFQSQAGQGDVH